MEAYSPPVDMLPIAVGGLAGHIFPPGAGRFVGGCAGFARLAEADRRCVGGSLGHVSQPGPRRFVGGCAGFVQLGTFHATSRLESHVRRTPRITWDEEALEGAPA
jgi:hypothetical protein